MSALDELIKDCRAMDTQTVCLTFSDIEIVGKAAAELAELRTEYKAARQVIEIYAGAYAGDKYASNWLKKHPIPKGAK